MNLPYWTISLIPPLLLLAYVLACGPFGRRPGQRQAAAPARHFPGVRARRDRDSDAASALAWLHRLERDSDITPAAAAQIQAHVCGQLLQQLQPLPRPPAWEPIPPHTGELPPSMQDDDPRYPHLREGQYGDWSTGQFAVVMGDR